MTVSLPFVITSGMSNEELLFALDRNFKTIETSFAPLQHTTVQGFVPFADFNALITQGIFHGQFVNALTNEPLAGGANSRWLTLEVTNWDGNHIVQVLHYELGWGEGRAFWRMRDSLGTWREWREIWTNVTADSIVPLRGGDRWYCANLYNSATPLVNDAPSANILRAMPIVLTRNAVIDRIAINIVTGVAGSARLGIYRSANVYPSSLIVDSGIISTGSAGVQAATLNTFLTPGLYWLVMVANVAPTIRAMPLAGCAAILGQSASLETTPGVGWSVAFAFAALPAMFPAGAAPITAIPIPAIFVRTT